VLTEAEFNERLLELVHDVQELAAQSDNPAMSRRLYEIADETSALIHIAVRPTGRS
jgi:hypothetical protein